MIDHHKLCHQHHLDRLNADLIRIVVRQLLTVPYEIITEISD